jgi:hypothetical protein
VTARTMAARRLANAALATLYPEEWARFYTAALRAREGPAADLQKPCACGQVMVRISPGARWPKRCTSCKEAAA